MIRGVVTAMKSLTPAKTLSRREREQPGSAAGLSHAPYTAKLASDTSNNTVCCTAGGKAAIQLARQASTAGA